MPVIIWFYECSSKTIIYWVLENKLVIDILVFVFSFLYWVSTIFFKGKLQFKRYMEFAVCVCVCVCVSV